MNKVLLNSIFDIEYGNSLDLTVLERCSDDFEDKVYYVSRTRENNGISATVKRLNHIEPFEPGLITVAGSGNSVLESFIQPAPFYTGYHVFILRPKRQITEKEKIFYCYCIRQNQYKYNFGRQANKTLGTLLVPGEVPEWVQELSPVSVPDSEPLLDRKIKLDISTWKWFKYSYLFNIERGRGARETDIVEDGMYPIVTSIDSNNGWSGFTNNVPKHDGNVISVARNGSVGESYYQPIPFCSTEDVHVFNPKFDLNPYIAQFLIPLIKKEKFRYNYGRKWGLARMKDSLIMLPAKSEEPDFEFMENYIKSLPFSASI